jgi:uncharacterized protein YkwD
MRGLPAGPRTGSGHAAVDAGRRFAENPGMRNALMVLALLGCAGPALAAKPEVEPVACLQREAPSSFEVAVLAEINRARQSPRDYADTLRGVFANMDASGVYSRGTRRVATSEGRAAVDEALRFLSAAAPMPPLRMATCLNLAAARHAKAKGSTGNYGHLGATGRNPSERASFLASSPVACSENIAYAYDDVAEMVAALIVDDAVPSRGHRHNIFDPRMQSFGSGRAAHLLRTSIDVHVFCLDDIRG